MSTTKRGQSTATLLVVPALAIGGTALAQSNNPQQLRAVQEQKLAQPPTASELMKVQMGKTTPGAVSTGANVKNPVSGDPMATERGMKYFVSFNCVGCHAPNGGGGMGPSLSDPAMFKYGTDPAALFLVITHGAPLGMPAWGTVLPENVIWDMVSYIESLKNVPRPAWGNTVSASEHLPGIEQVPAEFKQTATPWNFTEPFTDGKRPASQ